MSEELKPCPFGCSATPTLWKVKRFHEVGCPSCKCAGPLRDTEAEAIAAWNRRTEPTDAVPTVGEVELLTEIEAYLGFRSGEQARDLRQRVYAALRTMKGEAE